ncbi:MAG: hypothetical protein MJ210_01230 [Alphaproteobacteria bacterium]|nr:hypothetical protein [Alphaproteobacteria bacterium]
MWLQDIPVNRLQELYKQCNYEGIRGYLMLPSHQYPMIFLKNIPQNYDKITDEAERNALFIKIVAPLALKLNQEILIERKQIENIETKFHNGKKLSKKDINLLEEKAKKYDVFTRLKGTSRYSLLISELLKRIDQIPPSITITAAAIDTNWGTTQSIRQTNSLYKAYVWYTDNGLKPTGEKDDNSYRLKIYPDLYASIKDFALKLNSQRAFEMMRVMRSERRQVGDQNPGFLMAPYIYGYSPLPNYAGLFDYTLAYYELLEIDKSTLVDNMITETITKNFDLYKVKK